MYLFRYTYYDNSLNQMVQCIGNPLTCRPSRISRLRAPRGRAIWPQATQSRLSPVQNPASRCRCQFSSRSYPICCPYQNRGGGPGNTGHRAAASLQPRWALSTLNRIVKSLHTIRSKTPTTISIATTFISSN